LPTVASVAALTRQENAAMKARMKEKAKAGGDAKALDADLQAARKEAADRRKAEKEAAAAKMAAENKAQKAKLKKCAATPAPSPQYAATRTAHLWHAPRTYCIGIGTATHGVCFLLGSTGARTDNDLLDDVAEDGTSLAEARAQKAKEGADAKDARAKDAANRAAQLKDMKKNTAARTDNDLLDDVDADGNSVAASREQMAKDSAAARAQLPM
jgi:hypothetical protein